MVIVGNLGGNYFFLGGIQLLQKGKECLGLDGGEGKN